jgi:hypothetical protein
MISPNDIEWETQFAILWFIKNAKPCVTCKKQPAHEYTPGARKISCGGEKCAKSVTDSKLSKSFQHWNSLQNKLAAGIKLQ